MSVSTINVPRVTGFTEADKATAPVWWFASDSKGGRVVLLTCGGCGMPVGIDGWEIAGDGTVSPSLHHVLPDCGWHVFVRLLDWDGAI